MEGQSVIPRIALASDVGLPVVKSKDVDKALIEPTELVTKLDFVCNVWYSLRISYADGLFNPKHVCKVVPAVGVRDGSERARLPGEATIFSKETTE